MAAVQCVILDVFYNWLIFNIVINFVFFCIFAQKLLFLYCFL